MKNYNLYFNLSLVFVLLIIVLSCQFIIFEGFIDFGIQFSEFSQVLFFDGDNFSGEMFVIIGVVNSFEINYY